MSINRHSTMSNSHHRILSSKWLVETQPSASLVAMKFFQLVQKSCQAMGILPSNQSPKSSINFITLLILLPTMLFAISSSAFLLFEAQSIQEYRDSVYTCTSMFVCLANFAVIVCKMPNYLQMIEKFEKFVQKRE